MSRQVGFDDLIPTSFKMSVVGFCNEQLRQRMENNECPVINNQHEAYGRLAESFVLLQKANGSAKSGMSDTLSALPASDSAFYGAVDQVYDGCISVAQAAIHMAVAALNIAHQRVYHDNGPTPFEELAELPDDIPGGEEPEDTNMPDIDAMEIAQEDDING